MRGFRLTFISLGGSFAILSKCCRSGENKMRTQSGDLHRSWVLDVAREGQTAKAILKNCLEKGAVSTPTRRLHLDAIPQQASAGRFPTGWRQMVAFLAPPAAHLRRPRGASVQTGRAARAPRCRTRGRARPHPPSHAQLGASRSKHTGGCARQLGLDFVFSPSPVLLCFT